MMEQDDETVPLFVPVLECGICDVVIEDLVSGTSYKCWGCRRRYHWQCCDKPKVYTKENDLAKVYYCADGLCANFETKQALDIEIKKIETEIGAIQASLAESVASSDEKPKKTKYVKELSEYAFDQSDKFVKIFNPFSDAKINDEDVQFDVTASSFNLYIKGDHKDYRFQVRNFLKKVDVKGSFRKVKKDEMVTVYLKKVIDGDKWECLTKTEKTLRDQKNKTFEDEKEATSNDPMSGLMNIMKKMYDSGDSEMKRSIAKAWTEKKDSNSF